MKNFKISIKINKKKCICKKIVNECKRKSHSKNFKKEIYLNQKTSEHGIKFTYIKEKIKIILKI